jgi:hypothetical protein
MIQTLDILDKWVERVNDRDVDGVVNMYAKSATLLPTFSPDVISTIEGIKEYFVELFSKSHLIVKLQKQTVLEHHIGESGLCVHGIYHFTLRVDEEMVTFPSEYVFLVGVRN